MNNHRSTQINKHKREHVICRWKSRTWLGTGINMTCTQNLIFFILPATVVYYQTGLNINVCPIPVKTDVGQVDLVLWLSDGTSEKNQIPKRAGTTDKSISTGIKYWVCFIKESCLISNLSIIYFD